MPDTEYESKVREVAKKVKWDNVKVIDPEEEETYDRPDTDELMDNLDDHELEKYYEWYR